MKLSLVPRRLRAPLALLATLAPVACSSPKSSEEIGSVDVTVSSLFSRPISSLRVTVESPSQPTNPLSIPLALKGAQSSVLVRNLPATSHYLITGDALDGNNVAVAHGVAGTASIVGGRTTKAIIYLSSVIPAPASSNSAPLVDSIALSTDTVDPGAQVSISGLAHDPDPGETATLDLAWEPTAGCGTITGATNLPGTDVNPSESQATWTAPVTEGICELAFTATDVLGLATTVTFVVRVGSIAAESGAAAVALVFNDPPNIAAISAAPAQLSSSAPTTGMMEVIATNPQGKPLGYAWSSDPTSPCTVDFATPGAAATPFTATPTQAGATFCTFVVAVSNGIGPDGGVELSTSTARLTLAMTPPVLVQIPPAFGIAYQSDDTAAGGVRVTFGAIAFDPEGGSLSFAWSAAAGSPPQTSDPILVGLDPAFSTAATWTPPPGAESMTSNLHVSVTATSSASNLQSTMTLSLTPADLH